MFEKIDLFTGIILIFVTIGGGTLIGIATGCPFATWIGNRVGDFLSFLPRERFEVAPPPLGIAASKAANGDLAGAVDSYESMLADHPGDREIYIRLIELLLGPLDREKRGEEILRQGLRQLPDERDREILVNVSAALRNGTHRPYRYLDYHADPRPEGSIPPPLFSPPPSLGSHGTVTT